MILDKLSVDKDIMNGQICVEGTRITALVISEYAETMSHKEIRDMMENSDLTDDVIDQCVEVVKAMKTTSKANWEDWN